MLLSAGIVGTATGVWLFTELRALDQLDLVIGLSYVTLLTVVGGMMIYESVQAVMRTRRGGPATLRRPGSHTWIHGLPFKLRFKRSKIYVSAIPVWVIGFSIGFVGAIMGIGGVDMLIPPSALAVLLGSLLAAVAGGSAMAQSHLRIGLAEDPDVLDPSLARTYVGRIVFAAICDKLNRLAEVLGGAVDEKRRPRCDVKNDPSASAESSGTVIILRPPRHRTFL